MNVVTKLAVRREEAVFIHGARLHTILLALTEYCFGDRVVTRRELSRADEVIHA